MKPTISVIVPVYNGAPFISPTLDSILSQEGGPPDEVIVIDDGSTDQTPLVLSKYEGRIIYHRIPNSGVAEARNKGLEISTGQLVAFCDYDDLWAKDKLQKQLSVLDRFPMVGLCGGNFIRFHTAPNNDSKDHFAQLKFRRGMIMDARMTGMPFRLLLRENFIGTASTVILRRNLVETVGFFAPGYVPSEDYDYWLRCAMVTDFFLLSDILVYKRIHEFNLSHEQIRLYTRSKQVIEDIGKQYGSYIQGKKLIADCNLSRAWHSGRLGDEYFEAGKMRKAFRLYCNGMGEAVTAGNLASSVWKMAKKTIRLITFDCVNRHKLRLWGKSILRRCNPARQG